MSKIGYVKNSLDNVLFLLEKEKKKINNAFRQWPSNYINFFGKIFSSQCLIFTFLDNSFSHF